MPKVTEILCMICMRPVTTTSPVFGEDDRIREYIAISRCRHLLMHMSCFVFAHPADPVTCRHPECHKGVDVVEANFIDRIIVENAEEKSNLVDELSTRLNLATSNALKVAQDKIAELEAIAKHLAELMVEAEKRSSEAKTAQLEAKMRHYAAEDKIAQLETNAKCNAELLVKADERANEAKAAELKATKRYDAAKARIAKLEANSKLKAQLLAKANKRTREAKAAELEAKKSYDAAKEKMAQLERNVKLKAQLLAKANKRASEAEEAELKAKKRYDAAKDNEMAKLEANAKHFLELEAEADKRISKAKAAELEAKKRYELVVGKLRNYLIACRCTASDFTFNLANSSPNKESVTVESIADFPNAMADFTPMSPPDSNDTFLLSSESIERPKVTTDTPTSTKFPLPHAEDPRVQLSSKKSAVTENPTSKLTLMSDNTTNHSLRRKISDQMTAIIAREDRSPAAKRSKGASESITPDYERYWQQFGVTPPTLRRFVPLKSFPMGYTVAGIPDAKKVTKLAILADDVLLLGDGHVSGIANYVLKDNPFKDELFESLYRRDLSIVDLITTLNRFAALPEKIILSIGNWDATRDMQCSQFQAHFKILLQIFKKCRVKNLYILPIIFYPGMGLNTTFISNCLNTDWSETFGGQYEFLLEMTCNAINLQLPADVDDKGPMYEVDKYASLVAAIRDRFIRPVATTLPTEGEEEAKAS